MARITPCLENGKGALVDGLPNGVAGQGSTEFIVLRAHDHRDAQFLYYVTRNPSFHSYAVQRMVGTSGRQRVAWQSLVDYEMVDLSPEERHEIGNILGALDNKIVHNAAMNKTLEASARALFRDWFVDFGPTRARAQGVPAWLAPDLWSLFPDRLADDGVPNGWELVPLTDLFQIIGGGTPKTTKADYWGGKIPWFSVVDTPPIGSVYVVDTEKTITAAGLAGSSARLVGEETTIISARGTVGNLAMTARPMTFNQSCYALQGKGPVGPIYVHLATQHMVNDLRARAHGSVFATITRDTFTGICMPMVSSAVFEAFERAAGPLFARIKANVIESRSLAATRDVLLPKFMSGQVRITEVEHLTEAA